MLYISKVSIRFFNLTNDFLLLQYRGAILLLCLCAHNYTVAKKRKKREKRVHVCLHDREGKRKEEAPPPNPHTHGLTAYYPAKAWEGLSHRPQ